MREMHKWKDKVEFSLDNRQLFFLFFGLSVVGCFVFALGVMVGRRVEFSETGVGVSEVGRDGEVAALSGENLSLLEALESEPLAFKEGLAKPAETAVPAPAAEPQPAAGAAPTEPVENKPAPGKPAAAQPAPGKAAPSKPTPSNPGEAKPAAAAVADPQVLSGRDDALSSDASPGSKKFTLQMKAFARREDAEAFAKPLRDHGHQVRVEAHEIKGRLWYRVRVGEFDNWTEGLHAKQSFEQAEQIIAYVVKM